jgi:hypothetical protein
MQVRLLNWDPPDHPPDYPMLLNRCSGLKGPASYSTSALQMSPHHSRDHRR